MGRRPRMSRIFWYSSVGEAELLEWLRYLRSPAATSTVSSPLTPPARSRSCESTVPGSLDRSRAAQSRAANAVTTEVKKPSPSADGPVSGSMACSGCGIRPNTLPSALQMPAMSRAEPLGAPSAYLTTTRPARSSSSRVASSATKAPSPFLTGTVSSCAAGEARRPGGPRVAHGQPHVGVDEPQARVPGQRAGQQVRLAEDLEAVADAEHRQSRPGRGDQLAHHRGEPGDRAAAQVVAVREAAGQDHRVDAAQVAVGVPERDRLRSRVPHGAGRIGVVQ